MSGFEILGAVEFGLNYANILIQYAKDVKHAPSDMADMLRQIGRSKDLLETIQKFYRNASQNAPDPQLNAYIYENVKAYGSLFKDLEDYVDDYRKPQWAQLARRYRWPLKRSDFSKRFDEVQRFDRDIAHRREFQTQQNVNHVAELLDFETFLGRLLPTTELNRIEHQRAFLYAKSQRSRPTWIYDTEPFKRWFSKKETQTLWLWGFGEAGCGKSCVVSFLARHLHENSMSVPVGYDDQSPTKPVGVGVALFYCSHKFLDRQDPETILRCMIRQLLDQLRDINPQAASQRVKEVQKMLSPTKNQGQIDSRKLLENLCKDFQRTYLIIDALDENSTASEAVLMSLTNIEAPHLRIFVTSRPGLRKLADSQRAQVLDLTQNDEAIEAHVSKCLDDIATQDHVVVETFLREFLRDDQNRQMALEKILDAAKNNFLCAELHVRALKDADDEAHAVQILSALKRTVRELVHDALDRVRRQARDEGASEGMRALLFIIYSNEALTVSQLKHAMTLTLHRSGRLEAHLEMMTSFNKRRIGESTAYLVEFDDNAQTVQVQRAIRDYCVNTDVQREYYPDALVEIAEICLRCLDPVYDDQSVSNLKEWKTRLQRSPFLSYSVQNWGWHVAQLIQAREEESTDPSIASRAKAVIEHALRLLQQRAVLVTMNFGLLTGMRALNMLSPELEHDFLSNGKPIFSASHVFTHFNLNDMMVRWINKGNDADALSRTIDPSEKGFSALWQACRVSQEETAFILLEHGADPVQENEHQRFALNQAAIRGLSKVVSCIVGQPPYTRGQMCMRQSISSSRSPLSLAIQTDRNDTRLAIFKMLWNVTKEMPEASELLFKRASNNETLMHEAARHGRHRILRLLARDLDGKKLLEERGNGQWNETPLHLAAYFGWTECVRTLLESGADPSARNAGGVTPMSLCVRQPFRHEERRVVMKMLLDHTDPRLVDDAGRNVLHSAAEFGRPRNLKLLLETLSRPIVEELLTARNNIGETPLMAAATARQHAWQLCFNHCLEHMIGVISDEDAKAVFATKKEFQHEIRVPHEILDGVTNPWAIIGDDRRWALHMVVQAGTPAFVKRIWEELKQTNPEVLDAKDNDGKTPLILAVEGRRPLIISLLIDSGADVNARGNGGKTALHYAAELAFPQIAKLLIPHAKLDAKDDSGCTALAQCSRHNACRPLLLNAAGLEDTEQGKWREEERVHAARSEWTLTVGNQSDVDRVRSSQAVVLGKVDWDYATVPVSIGIGEYLVSHPIPGDAKLPLTRVHVVVEGRDQGWSSDEWFKERREGSFTSETGYCLGIMRNGEVIQSCEWARNKHRSKQTHTFECSWYLDKSRNERRFGGRRSSDSDDQSRFVKSLRAGDRVVLLAAANGLAWMNITKRAEIQLFEERNEHADDKHVVVHAPKRTEQTARKE